MKLRLVLRYETEAAKYARWIDEDEKEGSPKRYVDLLVHLPEDGARYTCSMTLMVGGALTEKMGTRDGLPEEMLIISGAGGSPVGIPNDATFEEVFEDVYTYLLLEVL